MTRIKRVILISTAIILCMLTVTSATCTFVCSYGEDARSTQFFAVPVSCTIKAFPAPSLAKPINKVVISWLRREESIFEKDEMYKLSSTDKALISNDKSFLKTKLFRKDLYICLISTSYHMRI